MAKNIKMTTPAGTARWPWLNKADTKFKPEGEYKVTLVVSKKEVKPLLDAASKIVQEIMANNKIKKRAPFPIVAETDDQGNETGNMLVKCAVKCREGWDRKPKLFDAEGNRIDVKVGGGSTIKVNVELYGWHNAALGAGVMLQPIAVQVLDLVEHEAGGSAESFGFGKEKGFVGTKFDGSNTEETASETVSEESEDGDLF